MMLITIAFANHMSTLLASVLEVLWFFVPAFAGNIAPILATRYNWLPRLNIPADGGLNLGNARLLGQNKTVRGFFVGTVAGALFAAIQFLALRQLNASEFGLVHSQNIWTATVLGSLVAFGALLGDALKSFYKRRLGIMPGESWKPWDQIDIVIGVLLVTAWFVPFTLVHIVTGILIVGIGMLVSSYVGYAVGIKQAI